MKIFTGKVVSKNMQKTATVAVRRVMAHPIYKKRIRKVKKYHVHDEMGSEIGQVVKFIASKPYSKLKKWKIIEVVGGKVVNRKKGNTEKSEVTENTEVVEGTAASDKSTSSQGKKSNTKKKTASRKKKGAKK